MVQLSVAARAPINPGSYRRCRDALAPGQLKRVSVGPNRALIGYVIACPACGAARPYLHDDVGFVEARDAPNCAPDLVGIDRPPRCSCGLSLRIVREPGAVLEAYAA